jgi:hypothetical protein
MDRKRQGLSKLSADLLAKASDETATQVNRILLTFVGTTIFCLLSLLTPDAAEVVLERLHRVEHRGRPVADARVQPPSGGHQKREAGACLLVAYTDIAFLIATPANPPIT